MAKVDKTYWIIGDHSEVTIEGFYETPDGIGRFHLTSTTPTNLAPTAPQLHCGSATYTVTPGDSLTFEWHLFCEHANAATGGAISMQVSQNGAIVKCLDDNGNPLNGNGGAPVHILDLPQATPNNLSFHIVVTP